MKVPFLDLKAQYETIRDEVAVAIQGVLDKTAFAGGPFVSKFEEEFSEFCGTQYGVGCGSGTDALWLALLTLGIGQGDEVITAANTFIATTESISYCGAKPVLVDVCEDTYNINPELIEAAITENTKAIIPVHLYGQMADMDPIMEIARKHKLFVVEDASQAHGAEYKGRLAGSIGDIGCFSFYPGKNLGAYGEAGAAVTNNQEWADKMKMIRDHGQEKKYYHSLLGWNARMDGFQGAILSVKLKNLPSWNNGRIENAALYTKLLSDCEGVKLPKIRDAHKHVFHIYAILVKDRDKLMADLAKKDIFCAIHYPVPIHLQKAYDFLGLGKGDFPVSEEVAEQLVSLPMFAELTKEQIEYVCEEIKKLV